MKLTEKIPTDQKLQMLLVVVLICVVLAAFGTEIHAVVQLVQGKEVAK
jgi:hypothetical protein